MYIHAYIYVHARETHINYAYKFSMHNRLYINKTLMQANFTLGHVSSYIIAMTLS